MKEIILLVKGYEMYTLQTTYNLNEINGGKKKNVAVNQKNHVNQNHVNQKNHDVKTKPVVKYNHPLYLKYK